MGTNYYHRVKIKDACNHCGRSADFEERHIGKSSAGWCFSLHVYPDEGIRDLDDWRPRFDTGEIRDEYGKEVSPAEMIRTITMRMMKNPIEMSLVGTGRTLADFFGSNQCEKGPNNLLRSRIGGNCIGHGSGTWDLQTGDFS